MSACHKEAVLKFVSLETNVNIAASISNEKLRQMRENRACLLKIISSLRYLSDQGIPIRGQSSDERSNFNNLLNLRSEDSVELQKWLNRDSYKWMSHEIQNEILNMSHSVLRKLVQNVKNTVYFSIIADETSDITTKEQFSFCVRYKNLKV
ncbi:unnamed protein product [Lasius platythorax]|uniref:DUF4371 domain-containing protein n=1 Tax=Lasius platythorax TaxID=488582 RepID=A0AAV2MYP8_9HYME